MKKYIIASILVFLADTCHSNEWIPIGQQPNLEETGVLEVKLWKLLKSKGKTKFEAKESYRFQYQYISKSVVFINAICLPFPKPNSDPGVFPGPTTEILKKEIYEVMDGGSCFFNVEYNIESGTFTSLSVNGEA